MTLPVHVVGDDEVDVADVGEQPQHVVDVGVLDVEIDRRAVVLRARRAQVAVGVAPCAATQRSSTTSSAHHAPV